MIDVFNNDMNSHPYQLSVAFLVMVIFAKTIRELLQADLCTLADIYQTCFDNISCFTKWNKSLENTNIKMHSFLVWNLRTKLFSRRIVTSVRNRPKSNEVANRSPSEWYFFIRESNHEFTKDIINSCILPRNYPTKHNRA